MTTKKLGLTKQYESIPLAGGLDLKTDPKQVNPPNLLQADNVMYVTNQMLRKRHGWQTVSLSGISDTPVVNLTTTANELLTAGQTTWYANDFAAGGGNWQARGNAPAVSFSGRTIFSASNLNLPATGTPGTNPPSASPLQVPGIPEGAQMVTHLSITYVAWCQRFSAPVSTTGPLQGNSQIYYGAVDAAGTWVSGPHASGLVSNGSEGFSDPTIIIVGNYVYLFAIQTLAATVLGSTVYTRTLVNYVNSLVSGVADFSAAGGVGITLYDDSVAQSIIPQTGYTVSTDVTTNIYIALTLHGDTTGFRLYVSNSINGGTGVITVDASPQHNTLGGSTFAVRLCSAVVQPFGTNKIGIGVAMASGSYGFTVFDTGGSSFSSLLTYTGASAYLPMGLTGTGSDNFYWATTSSNTCKLRKFAYAGTLTTTWTIAPPSTSGADPMAFFCNPIVDGSEANLYLVYSFQQTTFVSRLVLSLANNSTSIDIVGRAFYLAGYPFQPPQTGLTSAGNLGTAQAPAFSATYKLLIPVPTQILGTTAGFTAALGKAVIFTLNLAASWQPSLQVRGGVLLGGPFPQYYMGVAATEAGYSIVPDVSQVSVTLTGNNSTGSLSASSTYLYRCVFTFQDEAGNIHYSAPSAPIKVTTSSGSTFYDAAFSNAPNYDKGQLDWYRTVAGGASWFYAGTSWSFTDTALQDTVITGNPELYTDFGEIPNNPPPPCTFLTTSSNRAYAVAMDVPTQFYYSKPYRAGRGVEWSANQFMEIDPASGSVMGLGILDANIFVFKKNKIFVFSGTGPDATGANNDFTIPAPLPSDCGCISSTSIISTTHGVYFQSQRGICRINRQLTIEYVGLPIDTLTTAVVATQLVPEVHQLRFLTAGSQWYVFDYLRSAWSTYSGLASTAATVSPVTSGPYYILTTGPAIWNETTSFLDPGSTPITMTVQTPWLKTAGLQGWGRTYRAALLGDYKSASSLNVTLKYDYNTSYSDSLVFNTSTGLINGDSVFQFRMSRLPRQVMQAVTFTFADSGTTGESYDISNLTLEFGQKAGLVKLPGQKTL